MVKNCKKKQCVVRTLGQFEGLTEARNTTANIPYSSLGLDDNKTADDLGSERLSPLHELI